MKDLCPTLLKTMQQGNDAVLVTVLARIGSAPRGTGAAMLVFRNGTQLGTVGGGAIEHAATQEAAAMFTRGGSMLKEYRLNANDIAAAGMICGGCVTLLYQYFEPTEAVCVLLENLTHARDAGRHAALVRKLEGDHVSGMGWFDGEKLRGLDAVLPDAPKSVPYLSEDGSLLFEPVSLGTRALIFGGGHVAQKLVPLLSYVGFRCVVCDDMAAFADPRLFPDAVSTLLGSFSTLGSFTPVCSDDFAVVLTRGHQADFAVLNQLLFTDAAYIGCIGSRHKVAMIRGLLMQNGHSGEDCDRVHMPIGLKIGAQTPEEIAVSITAEMIQCRGRAV